MLRLCFYELKKFKRQKMIRTLAIIGICVTTASTLLCIYQKLSYRSLNGFNVLFGSFLVAPCLFYMLLLTLFQMEEDNDTLKNILLTNIPKSKLFFVKLFTAFSVIIFYTFIQWGIGLLGGIWLKNFGNLLAALFSNIITMVYSIVSSLYILIIIVLCRKKYILSMILSSCCIIIDFLIVWQLTMLNWLDMYFPVAIAFRITYPIQIIEYTQNLQYGLEKLYFPLLNGNAVILIFMLISLLFGVWIYNKQEC